MGERQKRQGNETEEEHAEEQQTQIVEVPIDLELINNKLNHLISRVAIIEQNISKLVEVKN